MEDLRKTLEQLEQEAARVLHRVNDADLSVVTAESCTGGLLASLLTDIEGLSGAFERGFVVYSEKAKCELLGLEQRMIDRCGAVSAITAEGMARGALDHSHADVAVAITGFAGPGGEGDEEGLVYLAGMRRGRDPVIREEHFGTIGREAVRLATVKAALEMLDAAV
jgi:nicotinamide-nucleotide amidase